MSWWKDNGSSVIAAGSSFGSGLFSTIANLFTAQKNREFQAEEAQKQRDWQESMWNKENEYNLPSNQVMRLKAAGYNPYAIDSDATATSVGQGSTASTPNQPPLNFDFIHQGAMAAINTKIQQEQLKQMREQTKSIYLDNVKKAFDNGNLDEVYQKQIQQLDADLKAKNITNDTYQTQKNMLQLEYEQRKSAADSGINPIVDSHNESVQRVIESQARTVTENLSRIPRIAQIKAKTALDNLAYELDNKYGREIMKGDAKMSGVAFRKAVAELNEYLAGSDFRTRMLSAGADKAEIDALVASYDSLLSKLDSEYLRDLIGSEYGDSVRDPFALLVYAIANFDGIGIKLFGKSK